MKLKLPVNNRERGGISIVPIPVRTWAFKKEGCINEDRSEVSLCKNCKLNEWECIILKEDSKYEFIYTVNGDY